MKIKANCRIENVAGKHMLILDDPASPAVFGVSEPVAWLLSKLGTGVFSEETLVDMLCAEYEIDGVTAKSDVEALVALLMEYGVLE